MIESFASETALPTTAEAIPAFTVVFLTSMLLIAEPKLDATPPATNAEVSATVEISEKITFASATVTSPLPAAIPETSDTPFMLAPSTVAELTASLPSIRPATPATYSAPLTLVFLMLIPFKLPSHEA